MPAAAGIRAWAARAIADLAQGELTIRIVAESESAELNSRYRRKQGPTNVLAFPSEAPAVSAEELLPLGDLVICAQVVAREAREQGKSLEAHWAHIVIHGALHLIGYDHETEPEAQAMEERERELLAELGFADPEENRGEKSGSDCYFSSNSVEL
ncbi:MAG TPA: rRNA maturation RNase YbeY, partial [Gammaproteobacteria bacterium]|nr:rRNA maturation RNase YbeY [Gammaproteobacteria bacterium]